MAFIQLKCPNCGANLNIENNREIAFCEFCGCKILLQETINVKHTIDTKEQFGNMMTLAERAYKSNSFDEAFSYYTKALELSPENIEAIYMKSISKVYKEFPSSRININEFKASIELANKKIKNMKGKIEGFKYQKYEKNFTIRLQNLFDWTYEVSKLKKHYENRASIEKTIDRWCDFLFLSEIIIKNIQDIDSRELCKDKIFEFKYQLTNLYSISYSVRNSPDKVFEEHVEHYTVSNNFKKFVRNASDAILSIGGPNEKTIASVTNKDNKDNNSNVATLVIVMIVIFILAVCLVCFGGFAVLVMDDSTETNSSSTIIEEPEDEIIQTIGAINVNEEIQIENPIYQIGDEVIVDEKLQIIVNAFEFSEYADAKNLNPIGEGKKYCVVHLIAKNISTEEIEITDSWEQGNYTSTLVYNNDYQYHSTWALEPEFFMAHHSMLPLEEIECCLTFEVPMEVVENENKELVLLFGENKIDTIPKEWVLRDQVILESEP